MMDPFLAAYLPATLAASEALNTIVLNCWSRVSQPEYIESILHIIGSCWLYLCDQETGIANDVQAPELDRIRRQLLMTAKIMGSIWKDRDPKTMQGLSESLSKEPRLSALFSSCVT